MDHINKENKLDLTQLAQVTGGLRVSGISEGRDSHTNLFNGQIFVSVTFCEGEGYIPYKAVTDYIKNTIERDYGWKTCKETHIAECGHNGNTYVYRVCSVQGGKSTS